MKNNYEIFGKLRKIELIAEIPRMEFQFGEGELEVGNQGRSWTSNLNFSFSQETGAIGQQTPRIGDKGPKLLREFSAGCARHSGSTPRFFFLGPQFKKSLWPSTNQFFQLSICDED